MAVSTKPKTFIDEIGAIPGGEKIRLCIQCGTCTASCPNAERMAHTPSQLIAMIRANMRKEVLTSNAMWYCLTCYMCAARCPRGVVLTDIMHGLQGIAVRERMTHRRTLTPDMYGCFSDFVYSLGILPEFGFMSWYYLLTNPLHAYRMLPIAVALLRHGRLVVKARKLKPEAAEQLRAIISRVESRGGAA